MLFSSYRWNFSAEKTDGDTSRSTKRSRTYTLVVEQMQALHEPVTNVVVPDTVAVGKRARSSSPPLELSPAKKRPFSTVDETPVIDWAPSPSAMIEEEKDVAGGEEAVPPAETTKKTKPSKSKGKGKERAVIDEAMVMQD